MRFGLLVMLFLLHAAAMALPPMPEYRKAESFHILKLVGTYRQMGEQYAQRMNPVMERQYRDIIKGVLLKRGLTEKELLVAADQFLFNNLPWRWQQFFAGMTRYATLKPDQLKILAAMEFEFSLLSDQNAGHLADNRRGCTTFAVWQQHSADGRLLFGRNYDFGPELRTAAMDLTIMVLHPGSDAIPTAAIGFPGAFHLTTGLNQNGLFLALNNASRSDSAIDRNRISAPVMLFEMLLSSPDLNHLDAWLNTIRPDCAYTITAANNRAALAWEWSTFRTVCRRPAQFGVLAATNHFLASEWQNYRAIKTPGQLDHSQVRLDHLRGQTAATPKFDPTSFQRLFDLPYEQGGVTFGENTTYQVLARPADLHLWLKVPGRTAWISVDLQEWLSR